MNDSLDHLVTVAVSFGLNFAVFLGLGFAYARWIGPWIDRRWPRRGRRG